LEADQKGIEMTLYRWDSNERRFRQTSARVPAGNQSPLRLETEKGQRVRAEVATGDLLIRMIKGAWRMQIASSQLTVRDDEAVVIPSGFSHSAEAIEDSIALQTTDEQIFLVDDSRWAV
jgi:quercetin dioxygenase-like cupin family protein